MLLTGDMQDYCTKSYREYVSTNVYYQSVNSTEIAVEIVETIQDLMDEWLITAAKYVNCSMYFFTL